VLLEIDSGEINMLDRKRPAFRLLWENARSGPKDLYSATLRFTSLFNFGRSPAISFPAGFSSSGLPIGMQLAGRHLEEGLLLKAAHAFQMSTSWHACHPADLHGAP
jgi:Asp-tRNA(Asn)/Glu-tRNA(Gln) amidotransferase A subunit family amidase